MAPAQAFARGLCSTDVCSSWCQPVHVQALLRVVVAYLHQNALHIMPTKDSSHMLTMLL